MNPPWTDTYLNYIYSEKCLGMLRERFFVRFVVPIKEANFREFISREYANECVFVKRFFDASAKEFREVLFFYALLRSFKLFT